MPLHRRACALGLTLTLAITATSAVATPTDTDAIHYLEGRAFATNGQLIYSESHWLYDENGNPSRLVLYRCPDGKPFARKHLHDDGNAQAPDFEMDDARTGYREGVRRGNGQREIFVRSDKNGGERTAPLKTSPLPVIDAGFDAYTRSHWNTLGTAGESLPFLVPSRLGTLDFKVRRLADGQVEGHATRQYRLSLDSMIGFALPHLDVAYDAGTRQLLNFNGIANVRSSRGKNVEARILFDPSKNRAASRGDLDAANTAALDGQCNIP